jgi:opacity protein-like surface antigen
MKKLVLVLSVATLSAALAGSAFAEPTGMESNKMLSFGLGGGVAVPVSDAKDAFKNGFSGQGFVRLNMQGMGFAPRLDFTFSKFDLNSAKIAAPGTTVTGTSQMIAGLASLQFFVMPGDIRPYIIAGIGAYNLSTDVSGASGGSESNTRFGINGGAGVLLKLGHTLHAYIEGHIDNIYSDTGGVIDTNSIQVVPVTFGVVF